VLTQLITEANVVAIFQMQRRTASVIVGQQCTRRAALVADRSQVSLLGVVNRFYDRLRCILHRANHQTCHRRQAITY